MPDFFNSVLLSAPLPVDTRAQAMSVIATAERNMPWAGSLQGPASLILNSGNRWPTANIPEAVTSDPEQQRQWKAFVDAYSPMTKAVLKGEMAAAKAEGERLAANVSFWDTTYRATAGVASMGLSEVARLWSQLQEKLTQLKNDRLAAKVALEAVRKAVNDPVSGPGLADVRAQLAQLDAQQTQIGIGATSALGPIGSITGVKEDVGLSGYAGLSGYSRRAGLEGVSNLLGMAKGVGSKAMPWMTPAKLIAAAIGVTVLIAVISAIDTWVSKQAEVKMQANRLAMETLARKDLSAEQLFRDGKITASQYQSLLKENAVDVAAVRTANEGASFSGNMGKYLGITLGIAAIGAAIYFIAKSRKAKAAITG
jgi:hypothetical protein